MNQVELQRVIWVMGRGTLVHSLGSMNLSPMIPDGSEDGIRAACTKGRMIREMAHQL